MTCPVHDNNDGISTVKIYYFDPDYLATGNGTLNLCVYLSEDNYYPVAFTHYLYLDGIRVHTRNGTVAPGQHNWVPYTYSLEKVYNLVGYGSHVFNFGNDIEIYLNPARVFLFHSTANNDADEYDEFEMSNVTLSSEDGGYRTLTAKDGGIVTDLTISASSTNSSPKNSARFHKGAKAVNVTIGAGSLLQMDDGSILQGNISVTGELTASGTVNAAGANITLNVKDHSPENEYMISGASSLADASSCTITVKADQEEGKYRLANGFQGFAHYSLSNTVWENISFVVDGVSLTEEYDGQYTFVWNEETRSYNCIEHNNLIYNLNATYSLFEAGGLTLIVEDAEIPDQVLELLARKKDGNSFSVYEEQKAGDILTVEYDDKKYYFLVSCVVEDATGFDAMGLIRVTSNDPKNFKSLGQSVVVCRGSETETEISGNREDYLDWKDDFNPAGVGVGQFNGTAAAQLKNWLATRTEDEVYFTGHSLGGALAQRFSVYYNSINNSKIGGLVTFNAPGGADACGVVEINADKVHHYVVDGDMISMVGNGFVTGDRESDSWYTIYTNNDVFSGLYGIIIMDLTLDNTSGYLLNRHTQTWTSKNKLSESGDISELADPNFSYLGTVDNFNANYARYILSLATRYGNNKNDIICSSANTYLSISLATKVLVGVSILAGGTMGGAYYCYSSVCKYEECVADINTANSLTTRGKAEEFRKTTNYLDFIDVTLGVKNAPDDYGVKADIVLGNKDLISTDGSRKGHQIRTLEYGGDFDDLPDLLYDFTAQEFITIKQVRLENDFLFTSNDHNNNVKYVRKVSVEKNENTWICFSLSYSYDNFLELKSIMTESGETVSTGNYIVTKNKIIVLDDPSTTYSFNFQRDESITQTTAQIYVSEDNISIVTESIQLELSDIDASLTAGGGNDIVWVSVVTDSMAEPVNIKLTETAFEGVFSREFSVKEVDCKEPDITISCYDTLQITYNDAKNKDGNAEVIIKECTTAPLTLEIALDENGLPDGYTGEFKSLDWVEFQINTSPDTAVGEYVLIKNVENNIPVINLFDSIYDKSVEIKLNEYYHIDGRKYKLYVEDNNLFISVERSSRIISWDSFNPRNEYFVELSMDNFSTVSHYVVATNKIQLFNLPNGIYQYRVRAFDQEVWQEEGNIIVVAAQVGNKWSFDADNIPDVFFASASSVWEKGYFASHHGFFEGWTGTRECVSLVGKNKISDIFEGSNDANVLLLTDDSNGDALFIEDIFTALPYEIAEQQTRICNIGEIRAGAGDDIIDLTSQRFTLTSKEGLIVYGGDGDDVIWANTGYNVLFGDAGNDCLVGGDDIDIIAGGSGNDYMHGGGGDDIFTFGSNWGHDIVSQCEDGLVFLWFESGSYENWDEDKLLYTDGINSVQVVGVSQDNVLIVFGEEFGSDFYEVHKNGGVFADIASKKIFNETVGLLA